MRIIKMSKLFNRRKRNLNQIEDCESLKNIKSSYNDFNNNLHKWQEENSKACEEFRKELEKLEKFFKEA